VAIDLSQRLADIRRRGVEEIERTYLKKLLTRHRGRINDSAKTAGISSRQLHKLMVRYALEKNAFKNGPPKIKN
jgi:DNA-binding NtrC family response regulator